MKDKALQVFVYYVIPMVVTMLLLKYGLPCDRSCKALFVVVGIIPVINIAPAAVLTLMHLFVAFLSVLKLLIDWVA